MSQKSYFNSQVYDSPFNEYVNRNKEDLLVDYLQQRKMKGIVTSYESLPAYLKDDDLTEELFERYQKSPRKGAGYALFISNEKDTIEPSSFSETSPFHKRTFTNVELGSPEFHYKFNGYAALNDKINNYLSPTNNKQPDDKVIALTNESEVFRTPYTGISLPEQGNIGLGADSAGILKHNTLGKPLEQKRENANPMYTQKIPSHVTPITINSVDYNTTHAPKLDLDRKKPIKHKSSGNDPFRRPKIQPRKPQGVDFDAMATNLRQPLREQKSVSPWEYKLYEDIELMDPNKFSPYIKGKSCYINSSEIVANHGYGGSKNKSSRNHVFKLLEEVDGQLYYYGDNIAENYQNAIDCINRHLDNGRVIIVGVNHSPNQQINENATDHFITISGRGFDPISRQHYYTYYEVGSAQSKGYDTKLNRLIYDPVNLEFYDPASFREKKERYDVTQVRPNDGNTIGTVSQDATNPT